MPGDNPNTRHIHEEIAALARQRNFLRQLIAQSCEVLKTPVPDTFLGRKTQEPFPREPTASPEQER
ncbi:hypothetical protein [Bradyrhizobium sp. CCGE-LA001]|uniref:hypothetical protein n=1 Tax=Bradyrhizobium sp. CCGE-LA001 TaxID=1223566 RepID=UPI0002AA753D|nr:hypothetical protein [Bradyrhizobium sp. CCGE-LA001]AMA59377.1 hypothetical protein BCCGELA001_25965 [Bradyrhizobium sp. CCGE-LA001]